MTLRTGRNSVGRFRSLRSIKFSRPYLTLSITTTELAFDQDRDTGEDISFITNKTDGETIKMRRDRNVWVIDAYIEEDIEQGFTRPVAAP